MGLIKVYQIKSNIEFVAGVSGELDPPTFQMVDNSLYLMSHSHHQSLTCLPNPSKSIHTPNLNKLIRELEHAISLCLRISSFISQTNVLNMIQKHMFLLWLHGRLVDLFFLLQYFLVRKSRKLLSDTTRTSELLIWRLRQQGACSRVTAELILPARRSDPEL